MTCFNKKALVSLFSVGMICVSAVDAQACNRGGGGGSYSRPSTYNHSYSQPSYSHSYSQPTYHQPSYSRPSCISTSSQPTSFNSPPVQQQTQQFSQPVQQPAPQQITHAPQQRQIPQQQQLQQQAQVPQQQAPAQNAQQSAMQMLASFGNEQTQQASTPVQSQGFNGVGTWTATLPNSAVVTLILQADGNFSWTALNNGKQSTFEGAYNLTDTSLSLSRSNDSQKLDGALTLNGDSFIFKINGSSDTGLTFNRG